MKDFIFLGVVLWLVIPLCVTAQTPERSNLVWPFGYSGGENESYGVSVLDFRSDSIYTTFVFDAPSTGFGRVSGSFYTDRNGELALLSDGCRIYNGDLDVVSGEGFLHPGRISQDYCSSTSSSAYPVIAGSIMLPVEAADSTVVHFLSHNAKIIESPPYIISDTLGVWSFTSGADGNYELTNTTKLGVEQARVGKLAATRAPGDSTWWLATIGTVEEEITVFAVGGEEVLVENSTFPTGENWPQNVNFQAAFSPDGVHYVFASDVPDVWLFDFNPEIGVLNNLRRIELPPGGYSKGVCFSPNSELLYVTADTVLYQIEIATETVREVGSHFSYSESGWPINVGEMHLGPDCRIYVSPSSATWYLHVIHDPNQVGTGCDFQPRAIRTPTRLDFALPNMPLYRDGTDCLDIPWPFEAPTATGSIPLPVEKQYLVLSPNPARALVRLEWSLDPPPDSQATLELYDAIGRLVRHRALAVGEENTLRREGLAAGLYHWALSVDGRRVQTGRLVWVE